MVCTSAMEEHSQKLTWIVIFVSYSVQRTYVVFFFSSRRRHTRCSRDWSSDVCSSDLRSVSLVLAVVLPADPRVANATQKCVVRNSLSCHVLDEVTHFLSGVSCFDKQKGPDRSEEHTSELQSRLHLVCRLLLEKKKQHQHLW